MSREGLWEMHRIGFRNLVLKIMGWWAFDVFTQMAAFLPTDDLAGQAILRNIGLYTFMIPVGLGFATNYLVGKYMGANNVAVAKKA